MPPNSYKISNSAVHSVLSPRTSRRFNYGKMYSPLQSIVEQPIRQSSVNKIWLHEDHTYGKCTEKIQLFGGLSQIFSTEHSVVDFIPHRTSYTYFDQFRMLQLADGASRTETEMKTFDEFQNPEKAKSKRETIANYFTEKYKYTKEQLDVYSKFAQQMKDNTVAFEQF
ncbi:unnamed protein product, partial [Rotaria sp. Silwood1]